MATEHWPTFISQEQPGSHSCVDHFGLPWVCCKCHEAQWAFGSDKANGGIERNVKEYGGIAGKMKKTSLDNRCCSVHGCLSIWALHIKLTFSFLHFRFPVHKSSSDDGSGGEFDQVLWWVESDICSFYIFSPIVKWHLISTESCLSVKSLLTPTIVHCGYWF